MATEVDQATRLLPDQPGWTAGPAGLSELMGGTALARVYERGRARAFARVTAGPPAAVTVATMMHFAISDGADGTSGTLLLRHCKAHLVKSGGFVHSLSVILRGGPGDLPGSVLLEINGPRLSSAAVMELALGLDWNAIRAELADRYPLDRARIAAAQDAPLVLDARDGPMRLWPMSPCIATMVQTDKLERRRPPRFALVNSDAIHTTGHAVFNGIPILGNQDWDEPYFNALPTPHLVITHGQFAPDYLWPGIHLASARLRAAFDLGPDAIQYRNVDTTGSTDRVRAADYRMFRVVQRADPVDMRRMYGHEPDRDEHGNPTIAWITSITGPHATPRPTVWRDDFVPPAPLFRDWHGRFIATDALADRVMRAGILDVMFQDVTSEASLHAITLRQASDAGHP